MAWNKRLRAAQAVAFVALLAAVAGALGPAHAVGTTYSWPPPTLPTGTPDRLWYTPLLLTRHRPEALSASVPCSLPPPLPGAERPLTVLASARYPDRVGGLKVTRAGNRLVVRIGDRVLAGVRLAATDTGGACAYRLRLGSGQWSIAGGPDQIARGGRLETMPFVSSLFSALDLHSGAPMSLDVTTAVHATQTTVRQAVAWSIALLCVVVALLLVAVERKPRLGTATRQALRTAVAHAHPADAVVAIVLLAWWVLSPVFWDDGWVIARERNFSASGGFSHYYDKFGTNLPLDYWLEWAQHWIAQSATSLLLLRVPALLCLGATWVLCRWVLARVLSSSRRESSVALWALASAFLVCAMAWGMTLRPEPVSALLATGIMACTVRFLERESAAPVAVAAVLVPLALTGHHAAIVAFAPLVVVVPRLLRWARSQLAVVVTIVTAGVALLVVLAFVGSDLEQRRADARTTSMVVASEASWRDEIRRYVGLTTFPGGTPLRRTSVALIALAVLAFLLRRRRYGRSLLDLPAASLAVALVLLVATPSKYPWHFGTLIGLTALAVASESARLRSEGARSTRWQAQPVVAIGVALLGIAWSWSPRHSWNAVDLRTLDWTPAFESWLPVSTLAIVLPLVLLAGAVLNARSRGGGNRVHESPWRVTAWTAPVLATPLIALTVAVLAADAAKTDSWTLTRQNLGTFRGGLGCGLGDDLRVPRTDSVHSLATARGGALRSVPDWVPPAPVADLPRFALWPVADEGSARSPWFALPAGRRIGLFVAGTPGGSDRLALEWGRLRPGRVERVAADEVSWAVLAETGSILPWRFLSERELPAPEPTANVVRVTRSTDVLPGQPLSVTAPVAYASEKLAAQLERPASRSLVFPNLLTYFPCAQLPRLSHGIVEPPTTIVVPWDSKSPVRHTETSPFLGVLDLYPLERLSLADSDDPPSDFVVFGVDQRIPGAMLAAPTKTTNAS